MNLSQTSKSLVLTLVGYFFGVIGQLIIYPLFGISIVPTTALVLGLVFTCIAYCSNYLCLKLFDVLEPN